MIIINSTSFGKIIVNGQEYVKDIKILPSGNIIGRKGPKGSHIICFEELNEILGENPKVIVIGTGQEGIAEIESNVHEKTKASNIKLIVEPTPEATKIFNELNEKKAGLFHLTC